MRSVPVARVAQSLGNAVWRRYIGTCPVCGVSRPQKRNGVLEGHGGSGVGIHKSGLGWECFKCGESGDTPDFVSLTICGRRLPDASGSDLDQVREWCQSFLGELPSTSHAVPPPPVAAPPKYPPLAELRAIWDMCVRVDEVPCAAEFLRWSKVDPTTIADLDIARALPDEGPELPRFARYGGVDWRRSGHRILRKAVDFEGKTRSLLARNVTPGVEPKAIPPSGFERAGLVLVDPVAQRMLRYGPRHPSEWPDSPVPGWWPRDMPFEVLLVEGDVNSAAWSAVFGDAATTSPAVFGHVSGAWTEAHAARVPLGSRVTIVTDVDTSGDIYERTFLSSFEGRNDLHVIRWRNPVEEKKA